MHLLLLLSVLLGAPAKRPPLGPHVDLYTVGPGDGMYSLFGHAALCVSGERGKEDTCYNYGTADFSTPLPLGSSVLRGHAEFWVSTAPLPTMLAYYRREDRSVWKQRLPLTPEAAAELSEALARDAQPGRRGYAYHHFSDNCATRLRDHIDAATGGRLSSWGTRAHNRTFRRIVRERLAGVPRVAALSELVMGRALDRTPTLYEAMFLPDVLQRGVSEALDASPVLVNERKARAPQVDAMAGRDLLWKLCAPFGLAIATLLLLPWRTAIGFSRGMFSCLAGLGGVVFLALAMLSPLPELRWNETVLVLWPTDFILATRVTWLRGYVFVRAAVLIVVGVLLAAGVLIQPLGPVLAFVLPPIFALAARALYEDRVAARGP